MTLAIAIVMTVIEVIKWIIGYPDTDDDDDDDDEEAQVTAE